MVAVHILYCTLFYFYYWSQIAKWDPIFWNEEEEDPNVSYDKDDESEDDNKPLFPTKDPSSVRKDRDMFGTEEPDMMDLAEDKEMKLITTTTKNNENVVDEKVKR